MDSQEIIKIVATICHILRLKCTKFYFGWGSIAPDPDGGAYNAPPDSIAGFQAAKGEVGKRKGKEGRDGTGREERDGRGPQFEKKGPQHQMAGYGHEY